jgi:hypothetical protein
VAQRSRAEDLRQLLRAELAARLEPEGWRELGGDNNWFWLTAFGRQLNPDFMVTVRISRASGWPDRPPVVVTDLIAGISYEPLRRLYPLLGDFQYAIPLGGFDPDLGDGGDNDEDGWEAEDEEDEEDDEESWEGNRFEVRSEADVPAVAEQLAELVKESAQAFGDEVASVDALLGELGDPADDYLDVRRAAVLAAAGRYEEASTALERLKPSPGALTRHSGDRTARQLRRWIDSRGDPTLIPSEPPPDPHQQVDRGSMGDTWRQSRARDEAVKHVRANRGGKDRAALRAMLEEELAQRGIHESRIRIEATLDHLNDSPAEQLQNTVSALGRIGLGVLKMVREKRLPDLHPPDWLEPPERAAYELPRSDRWIEVSLTNDAHHWLDEVQAQIPSVFGVSTVRAWLSWEPESRQGAKVLSVHLGNHQVGTIGQGDAKAFIAVMDAAAFREELPVVRASLARRSTDPRYVVEVAAP